MPLPLAIIASKRDSTQPRCRPVKVLVMTSAFMVKETFRLSTSRWSETMTRSKKFSYFMIPKEPGKYSLGNYFQWVYFNPTTKKYDTLKSKQIVNVQGESKKNQSIESSDLGCFYDNADTASNQLQTRPNSGWIKWGANIFA